PAPTVTSASAAEYPIICARTVCAPAGTFRIRYVPSSLASAPRPVPSMMTCAPTSGCCVVTSTTRPVTVPADWAAAGSAGMSTRPSSAAANPRLRTRFGDIVLLLLVAFHRGRPRAIPLVRPPARCARTRANIPDIVFGDRQYHTDVTPRYSYAVVF